MNVLPPRLAEALAHVRSVGAVTGAGVSHESGIRTYRGKGGVYDDPDEGDRTVEALSGETFRSDPARTWKVIRHLLASAWDAKPNPGHEALVRIERKAERFSLLTQNVDGLHQAAGSRNVIDIHGDVRRTLCTGCGDVRPIASPEAVGELPACSRCGALLRPDVVLFGELLALEKVARLRRDFYEEVPDLVVVAGTTAVFPYVHEPVLLARAMGKLTIEVNLEPTLLSGAVDHSIVGAASVVLPAIASAMGA